MRKWLMIFGIGIFLWTGWGTAVIQAQSASLEVVRNEAIVNYPQEVTFELELAADSDVAAAVLSYDVEQISCLEADSDVPVEVEGETLTWTWQMVRSGNPPPGTTLWWEWTLTDSSGQQTTTPRQTLTFNDDRFDWRTVSAENIRLHWYEGEDVGPLLLEAAVTGLARLQNEMGIQLESEVQFFIYGDSNDMRQAVLYIQEWAGGVAFTEYNVILMGVPPDIAADWGRDTIQHELAHLVVAQFGRSCLGGSRPTWLDEGLAVYAQGEPAESVQQDIEAGIENNSFEPLRSLNGAFSSHGPSAGIAYSQSYSVVNFLLETYGQQQMQALLLALAQGLTYDAALEQVYGFNVDGLEMAWRESLGLPPRAIPPTPTPINPAAVPTIAPQGLPQSVPTPPAAAATAVPIGSPPPGSICNLTVLPLLLVGGLVWRRKRENS